MNGVFKVRVTVVVLAALAVYACGSSPPGRLVGVETMLDCLRMDREIGAPKYVVAGVWRRARDARRFNFIGGHGYAHMHPDEHVFCFPEYDVAQLGNLILVREAQSSFASVVANDLPDHALHAFCIDGEWIKELRTGFNGPVSEERPLRLGRLTRYLNRTFLAWNWELRESEARAAGQVERWIRVFPSHWALGRFRAEAFEKWRELYGSKAPDEPADLEACLEDDGAESERVGGYWRALFPAPTGSFDRDQFTVRQFFQDGRLVVDMQAHVSLSCGMLGLHCQRDGRLEPIRATVFVPGDICISWGMFIGEASHDPPAFVLTDEPGEEFDDVESEIVRLRRLPDWLSRPRCAEAAEGPKRDLCRSDLEWLDGWMDRHRPDWDRSAGRCGEGCPGCRRRESPDQPVQVRMPPFLGGDK